MDTKGVNTFPLYNVPPEPKISKWGISCAFQTFPHWIKEKSVATFAIRNIGFQNKKLKVSSPYHRTGDSAGDA